MSSKSLFPLFLSVLWLSSCEFSASKNQKKTDIDGFESSNLPLVVLEIGKVEKEEYHKGSIKIVDNADNINTFRDKITYYSKARYRIRGQTSSGFAKKSYTVKLLNEKADDISHPLLGLSSSSSWVFYAPYSDKSLLRNYVTYELSRSIGEWASRGRFVELFFSKMDDDKEELKYQGVYYVLERIEASPEKVNIQDNPLSEGVFEGYSGSYIFRIDPVGNSDINNKHVFFSDTFPKGVLPFSILFPRKQNCGVNKVDWLENYIELAYESLLSISDDGNNQSYKDFFDIDSIVNYMLIQDIVHDVDALGKSQYLHKDRNGKIKFGPIWDLNLAYGNADYYKGIGGSDFDRLQGIGYWIQYMVKDPEFRKKIKTRWDSLRKDKLSNKTIFNLIDAKAEFLSSAADRNFRKWDILGKYVTPNVDAELRKTYQDEIDYLKNFIERRLEWLDNYYNMLGDR